MGFLVSILFCLLTVTCLGQSTNKHMICKSVDDVFDDVASTGVSRRRHIGPPGKPGLPGNIGGRGLPGPKGSDGEVDYERLKEIVRARVEEETREMKIQFREVSKQLQNMTQKVNEMNVKFQNKGRPSMCDGVNYNGRCYWAEVHPNEDTNNAEALEICRKRGYRLADIYSRVHYEVIIDYMRSKLNGRPYSYVWTGMTKIYENHVAQLSDNTPAHYTKARPYSSYWDTAPKVYSHVYLLVREPSYTGPDQGMGAINPTWASNGALCQSQ